MGKKEDLSTNEKTDILQSSMYIDVIQKINMSDAPFKRILTYLSQVESPHSFQIEGYHVELEWTDTNITIQERMKEIFITI